MKTIGFHIGRIELYLYTLLCRWRPAGMDKIQKKSLTL